jgi:peptidoglycan/xylan/chitin deacetylase (PgdA/CDA1 family)
MTVATMSLLLRIDVDRPYGRAPLPRHALSRLASDFWCPRMEAAGYLKELKAMLTVLQRHRARAHVFFRRCTLPSRSVLQAMRDGGHEVGLHLEDSRSFECFLSEKSHLEAHVGAPVRALSKHGSGQHRYGRRHYAPYEPEKYVDWGRRTGMRLFMGNLEDPTVAATLDEDGFRSHPAAFWLEPPWRDVDRFTVDWLMDYARRSDVVLLVHPENIFADGALFRDFERVVASVETRVL